MRLVVSIEKREGLMHAEVKSAAGRKTVALFACPSLAGAVEPLLELLLVALESTRATVRDAGLGHELLRVQLTDDGAHALLDVDSSPSTANDVKDIDPERVGSGKHGQKKRRIEPLST